METANLSRLNEDVAINVFGLELKEWTEDDIDKPTECCAWFDKKGAKVYGPVLPNFHSNEEALKIVESLVFEKSLIFLTERKEEKEGVIFKASFLKSGCCLGEGKYHSLPIAICLAAIEAAKNLSK